MATVRLTPGSPTAAVGQQVILNITIQGARDLTSAPFHLVFNQSVLQYVSGEQGPFLGSDGRQVLFMAAPVSSGGRIVVGLSRLGPGAGISGNGLLCRMVFRVIRSGDAGIGLDQVVLWNSALQPVPVSAEAVSLWAQ